LVAISDSSEKQQGVITTSVACSYKSSYWKSVRVRMFRM